MVIKTYLHVKNSPQDTFRYHPARWFLKVPFSYFLRTTFCSIPPRISINENCTEVVLHTSWKTQTVFYNTPWLIRHRCSDYSVDRIFFPLFHHFLRIDEFNRFLYCYFSLKRETYECKILRNTTQTHVRQHVINQYPVGRPRLVLGLQPGL